MKQIAVTSRVEVDLQEYAWCSKQHIFSKEIIDKIIEFGFMPYLITDLIQVNYAVENCDGLIVFGNKDNIKTDYYENKAYVIDNNVVQEDDDFPLDRLAIRTFYNENKPILGICAGMQAINVTFGGTMKYTVLHHNDVRHDIYINNESMLSTIFDRFEISVNSYHTQAIDTVAPDFIEAAASEDGIIEAIESTNKLVTGVQWHPEIDGINGKLIFKHYFDKILKGI